MKMKNTWIALTVLAATSATAAVTTVTRNGVTMVPAAGTSYKDKLDFAEIEATFPLDREVLAKLTPQDLKEWDQESFDQLYARLSAGAIPDGIYNGTVVMPVSTHVDFLDQLGAAIGFPSTLPTMPLKSFAETLWKGKHFYKADGLLRNMITNVKTLRMLSPLHPVDLDKLPKTQIGNETTYEIFPAKVFCGSSLLDSRRESVIIDYAYTNELPGYQPGLDDLADRKHLAVRDEIRMVRPGFYVGRAYMRKVFALNFTLYNAEVAEAAAPVTEECWTGR